MSCSAAFLHHQRLLVVHIHATAMLVHEASYTSICDSCSCRLLVPSIAFFVTHTMAPTVHETRFTEPLRPLLRRLLVPRWNAFLKFITPWPRSYRKPNYTEHLRVLLRRLLAPLNASCSSIHALAKIVHDTGRLSRCMPLLRRLFVPLDPPSCSSHHVAIHMPPSDAEHLRVPAPQPSCTT